MVVSPYELYYEFWCVGCRVSRVGFFLFDEGLEAVGEVARQCLQQAGGLDQRGLQRTSELASSTSRLGRSASASTSLADRVLPDIDPPLMISSGLVRAASRSTLATAAASPSMKARAVGPTIRSASSATPAFSRGEAGQGVLVHLVLAALVAQLTAQAGQLTDLHAAVLGDDDRVGRLQLAGDLVDTATFSARGFSMCLYTSSRFHSWVLA